MTDTIDVGPARDATADARSTASSHDGAPSLTRFPKVIVTGASGWLGRRLVEALAAGNDEIGVAPIWPERVRCLVPTGEDLGSLKSLGTAIVRGDIRDKGAIATLLDSSDGAALIHLAGVIHPRRVRDFEAINTDGSAGLLAAAEAAGVARLVVMSSNSPFGANPTPQDTFTEESPYAPYMGYGRSKWRMERVLREAMDRPGGPEIVIARAPWFYGPGQPPRQTLFFSMIKDGRFPIFGSGENRRSMGYVDSLALGLMLCAATPSAAGQIYWLADERPYPMTEIVETVRTVLRDDFSINVAQKGPRFPGLIADVARIADRTLQGAGIYAQKVHVLSEMNLTIACDISKAKAELGYRPICELREGMRRSVDWCLRSGHTI